MRNKTLIPKKIWKLIAFIFFLSLSFNLSFATGFTPVNVGDTLEQPVKEHKLTREQFLEKYGRDDSSRAFINFYFTKRKKSEKMILISLATLIVLSIFAAVVFSNYSDRYPDRVDDYGAVSLIIFFGGGIYAASAFLITGIVRLMIYSRKKLLNLLKDYHAGHSFPSRITRSRAFAKWMEVERKNPRHRGAPKFQTYE